MNNLQSVTAEEYSKKYPHYRTYAQCQSRAFMVGTFTFISGTAGAYVLQELSKSRLWFARKTFILNSVVFGSVISYMITRHQTKICQKMWMAMEDKHTSLQSITERMELEKTPTEENFDASV